MGAAREQRGSMSEHRREEGEHERATRERGGAQREQMDKTGVSASKAARLELASGHVLLEIRRYYIYIYI